MEFSLLMLWRYLVEGRSDIVNESSTKTVRASFWLWICRLAPMFYHRFALAFHDLVLYLLEQVLYHLASIFTFSEAQLEEVKNHGAVPMRQLLLFVAQLASLGLLKHFSEDGRA